MNTLKLVRDRTFQLTFCFVHDTVRALLLKIVDQFELLPHSPCGKILAANESQAQRMDALVDKAWLHLLLQSLMHPTQS